MIDTLTKAGARPIARGDMATREVPGPYLKRNPLLIGAGAAQSADHAAE